MMVKCQLICEFFDGNIFMKMGALFGGPRVVWSVLIGLKIAKNNVFQGFEAGNGLENAFKVVFKEKLSLGRFPDT